MAHHINSDYQSGNPSLEAAGFSIGHAETPKHGDGEEHGGSKARLPHQMPHLNIVPMLDVCFNLLIFFLMSAQFSVGEGILPAELPAGQGQASKSPVDVPAQPIVIALRSLGGEAVSIEIEGMQAAPASFDELYDKLKSLQQSPSNPNAPYSDADPVIIKPDDTASWGGVVNAFNAAVRAKYKNVNFGQSANK
jgi:biopolymer transport protein ExbD